MDINQQPTKKPKDEGSSRMKFSWKPQPILAEEITRQPILEKCFVGVLKDKKGISKAITGLASCLPSPQHLKRCSGLRIYLAPLERFNNEAQDLAQFLRDKSFDLSLLKDEFDIVEVSSVAPRTKSQAAEAAKYWPVNFHPDQDLESLISGSLFNDSQLSSLEVCMKLAASVAENSAIGSPDCNGSALIIDPEESSILAMAASSSDQHPMWHASMIAIDLVARLQGGGAWPKLEITCDQVVKRKRRDATPLYYPDSLSKVQLPKECLYFEEAKPKKNTEGKCGPYLCTGYWAILLQEPCPLCAMALLHSRVSRIFYGAANPKTGILGSNARLHSVPGLNHRYQVWSSVLEDECVEALQKCRSV